MATVGIALNLDTYAQGDISLTQSLQKGFVGCTDIKTGFAVNAVANGDFLSLLKKGLTINLFKKEYMLWQVRGNILDCHNGLAHSLRLQKCFGNTRRHARDLHTPAPFARLESKRDDLNCDAPYNSGATRSPVTSGKVPAAK